MNIHPLLVHFPVALLTIYALLELVRFKFIIAQPYWFYVKASFVIIGGLALLPAYYFGQIAEHYYDGSRYVVSLHKAFASGLTALVGLIALAYLIEWLNRSGFFGYLSFYPRFMLRGPLVFIFALVVLILVFFTGVLGGILVYGSSGDVFTNAAYHLLFGNVPSLPPGSVGTAPAIKY